MTHTYHLIEVKMNMKARKKKQENKTRKKREMLRWLLLENFSVCLFFFLFQFSQVKS